jgi:cephalosporin hydroxylase
MNPIQQFEEQRSREITEQGQDLSLVRQSREWMLATTRHNYSYHFSWLGRPVIQFPQDIMALQEIIWQVRPDLVIETGIAHGGSLIFSASMLELIGGAGRVLGIDIDIRAHNRAAIEQHPMSRRIDLLEGSSIAPEIVARVHEAAAGKKAIVILDSNHTHAHVLQEMRAYSPLVSVGGYLIVLDTSIEDAPAELFANRPWGKGDNPRTAVDEFLRTCDRFVVDEQLEGKLLITVAPGGYLRCIKG